MLQAPWIVKTLRHISIELQVFSLTLPQWLHKNLQSCIGSKNGGRFPAKAGHDPFQQLHVMVPEYAHILT